MNEKTIFSELAEKKTVWVKGVDAVVGFKSPRVTICRREWQCGHQDGNVFIDATHDVLVDGYVYTPAVSAAWIERNIFAICQRVGKEIKAAHIGHGQLVNP